MINLINRHCQTAIIGAGAAGLFAGACLAERSGSSGSSSCSPGSSSASSSGTLLLEKGPRPGRKLLMAGSGQCNLTHGGDIKDFLSDYGPVGKSIRPILYRFGNDQVISFFQERGVPLFTREDGKVFPRSLRGEDVLNTLVNCISNSGGEFLYSSPVCAIESQPDGYLLRCCGNDGRRGKEAGFSVTAKNVIVATGGCSYPTTGSDGSFFPILAELGLQIEPTRPALVPIYTADYSYGELSGISFSPAEISLWDAVSGKCLATNTDDLLITHRCFSGPAILNISRFAFSGQQLRANYLPGQRSLPIEKKLKETANGENRQILHLLSGLFPNLPQRFLALLCRRAGAEASEKASRLSGSQLRTLATLLTADAHTVAGLGGFNAAMVTSGGVALSELNLKTLETKKHPGLYIVGEALNVDGNTGGYNLQFAFSSAHLAVSSLVF